jgi:hypothetical protein
MKSPRRSRLPAALLCVVLASGTLAAAGGPAAAGGTQPPGLDHFKCYKADPDRLDPYELLTDVILRDQFVQEPVKVAKFPDRLCNPVEKRHGDETYPPANPMAHLVCWKISSQQPLPAFEVLVLNQFGDARLTVDKRLRLCLPSWKALPGGELPPPTQPPGLDHFKCYRAAYSAVEDNRFEAKPKKVGLTDQFQSIQAKVKNPKELCNPVEKTRLDNGEVTPIMNPPAHLVCFEIKQQPPADGPIVRVKNQFGIGTLDVRAQELLCLPSFKNIVPGLTT